MQQAETEPKQQKTPATQRNAGLRFALFALTITILSCLLQWDGLRYDEIIDDHLLLHSPPDRGCGIHVADCFRHPQFGLYYRPVMAASYALGERWHGVDRPYPFHLENLVLHGLVVLLACAVFRLWFRRDRPALLAGLLFAVHPLHVGVTTWIGGRTDTICLFFLFWFVLGILLANRTAFAAGRWLWRIVSLVAFVGALFSKEQSGLLLFLVPLLVSEKEKRERGKEEAVSTAKEQDAHPIIAPINVKSSFLLLSISPFLWTVLYLVPVIGYALAARAVIPRDVIHPAPLSLGLRIELIGRTLWYYAKALVLPPVGMMHQSTLGPWSPPQPWIMLLGYMAAGVGLAILARVWPNRTMRGMALWTVLTLAPCLNIIPIPSQFIAPYRAVLPLVGVCGLVGSALDAAFARYAAWGVRDSAQRSPSLLLSSSPFLALAAICAWWIVVLRMDMPNWRSDQALEEAEIRADANFLPATVGLANQFRAQEKWQTALTLYDESQQRLFGNANAPASERIAQSRSPEMRVRVQSQSSLRYTPLYLIPDATRRRGGLRHQLGMLEGAADDYRVVLALDPSDDQVRDFLAACDEQLGDFGEAESLLREQVSRAPSRYSLNRLGKFYLSQRKWAASKEAYTRSLALARSAPDATASEVQQLEETITMLTTMLRAPRRP